MATAERFGLYPATLTHAGGDLDLAQIQNFNISPSPTVDRFYAAGAIDPKTHIIAFAEPEATFGTQDLTTYWGAVSPSAGLAITNATFRMQERSNLGGSFESTGQTWVMTDGFLVPTRLSCSQDSQTGCVQESRLVVLYDGSTSPIVHNDGVDFSGAPTPAFTSEFFLGPVYHNSSEIKGITQVDIDFGLNVTISRSSGQVYADKAYITTRGPRVTFTTLKCDADASLNQFLRALGGTTAIYLWKGTANGDRVAVATGAHFKLTISAGAWMTDTISVQDNQDGTISMSVMPTGTISTAVNSAIP